MTVLLERFANGDVGALSRVITAVEQEKPGVAALLDELERRHPEDCGPTSRTVGITGAPGAGKSTLTSALIGKARRDGRRVAVLAVDPSSPYSGGALLGDRLRMDAFVLDPDVFVRSMSARGRLGGLAPRTGDVVRLLRVFGFDEIIVESVGAGQSEYAVAGLVDTTVVVLTPDAGDAVQLEKAGIIEIADVFAVNKADLPGADAFARAVRVMQSIGPRRTWTPPVVKTVATADEPDVDALWEAIHTHREHLDAHGRTRTRAAAHQVAATVGEQARAWADRQSRRASASQSADPDLFTARLLDHLNLTEDLEPIPYLVPDPEARR